MSRVTVAMTNQVERTKCVSLHNNEQQRLCQASPMKPICDWTLIKFNKIWVLTVDNQDVRGYTRNKVICEFTPS